MLKSVYFPALLFVISQFLYWFASPQLSDQQSVLLLFIIFIVQSALLYRIFYKCKAYKKLPQILLYAALFSRLLVIFSEPILEDDYYRYLWDGHVLANKINPYKYAPSSNALDHLHTDYREHIGYINIPTIYPPLAEYTFALNSILAGGHLIGLKFIFVIFDLLTALILIKWLRLRNLPVALSLFYLLNPVVIKEIANSAHLDSMLGFFITLSLYNIDKILFVRNSRKFFSKHLGAISLALAAAIKLSPVFLGPVLIKFSKNKLMSILIFTLTLLLVCFPFLLSDHVMPGLFAFAKHWVINESLFYPISWLTTETIQLTSLNHIPWIKKQMLNEVPGKLVSATVLFLIIIKFYFNKKISVAGYSLLIIVSLLILSPVFNPWYVLWFLPMAIITQHHPSIALSLLLGLSYSYYLGDAYYQIIRAVEYLVFFGFLAYWHLTKKVVLKQSE